MTGQTIPPRPLRPPRLHGRSAELEAVEALLARLRADRGGALVLTGTPGLGRTALLAQVRRTFDEGTVWHAGATRAESRIPYGGLHALLSSAAADPPLRALRVLGAGLEPAALLELLGERTSVRPLLVCVDDVHLWDGPSRAALGFVARRLDTARPIGLLLSAAARGRPDGELAGLPLVRLGPLDPAAADALADDLAAGSLDPAVRRVLVRETVGNPRLLTDALAGLGPRQLGGELPLPRPLVAPDVLVRACGAGPGDLPSGTRLLLLLAAAAQEQDPYGHGADLLLVLRAAGAAGAGRAELAEAEDAGVLRVAGERVVFADEPLRRAVRDEVSPARRRQAHTLLALALAGERRRLPRLVHRALAAPGPDPRLAAELAAVAEDDPSRTHAERSVALERAAVLTEHDGARVARLAAAADHARLAGRPARARELLAAARPWPAHDAVRGRAELVRGLLELQDGPVADACEALRLAAELLAPYDAQRTDLALLAGMEAAWSAGDAESYLRITDGSGPSVPREVSVPHPTRALPPTGALPAPSGVLPTPSGALPTPSGALPAPSGALPAPSGALSAPSGALPTPSGALSAPSGALPAPSGALSAPSGALPAPSGALPAPSGALPAPSGALPRIPPQALPGAPTRAFPDVVPDVVLDAVPDALSDALPEDLSRVLPVVPAESLPAVRPTVWPARTFAAEYRAGMTDLLSGRTARGRQALRRLVERGERTGDPELLVCAGAAALVVGDLAAACRVHARALAVARSRGHATLVPLVLERLAYGELRAGRHLRARVHAEEGLRAALRTGQRNIAAHQHAVLALVASLAGDADTVAEHAAACSAVADPHGLALAASLAQWALARTDLSRGRAPEAAARLGPLVRPGPCGGHFAVRMLAVPCYVEAAVLAGAPQAAPAVVEEFAVWAEQGIDAAAPALLARCRALLETVDGRGEPAARDGTPPPDDDRTGPHPAEVHYTEALARHDLVGGDFERARTQLLFGNWLRRRRRPGEARGRLRDALVAFERCGAGAWARQARAELRATGDAPAAEPRGPLVRLTPQQLRIARFVAEGATNREVAMRLSVSPRTVDHHLRNVFALLGVRSRIELARFVDREDASGGGPGEPTPARYGFPARE
ncbi:LuxR C-terminal-related transcriptional regulator [Streptomyces adustus]|uniref:helix-turn-helix transcriptional regulator n=1 Tax=Streptomyces adustus TaxID=1609272 RepID=UPI0035D85083